MVISGSRVTALVMLFALLAIPAQLLARVDDSTSSLEGKSQEISPLEEVRAQRVFEEPLVPVGGLADRDELTALSAALQTFAAQANHEDLSPLTEFLALYPESAFSPSLRTELGALSYRQGYFTRAIEFWEAAWQELRGRQADSGEARELSYRTAGEIARMYARLGRRADVEALLAELKTGEFGGKAAAHLRGAHEAVYHMQTDPGRSFQCGPHALHEIGKFLGIKAADSALDLLST